MKKIYKVLEKLKKWWTAQSSTVKGFIILSILLIIGIILRWNVIIEQIKAGFAFFSK